MNILLVDDHPMTVEGVMNALLRMNFNENKATFAKAHTCKEGYDAILKTAKSAKLFDLAIIDQGLPSYLEQSIASGSDLVLMMRKEMPYCRIIMVTAHTEAIIIYDIAKNIRPDGLVNKNDINPDNLQLIVTEVIQGNRYQSPIIKKGISEIWKKELMVEDFNRQILLYLSKGFKVKELDGFVCLGPSAIQKRVILMKNAFEVAYDSGLVKEAIKQGFI